MRVGGMDSYDIFLINVITCVLTFVEFDLHKEQQVHLCPPGESVQTAGGRCLPSRGRPARVRLLANKHRGRSARKARQTNSNWTHGDKKHPLTPTSLNKC